VAFSLLLGNKSVFEKESALDCISIAYSVKAAVVGEEYLFGAAVGTDEEVVKPVLLVFDVKL